MKSRLSPALPIDLAATLYRAMLADAVAVAVEAATGPVALYWEGDPDEGGGFDLPAAIQVRRQQGADLGERLTRAFDESLAGGGDRAVAIGADCPDLEAATLRAAFDALDAADLVVGPAEDGGYYLIGLRRAAPGLFRGIAWGTGEVLAATLARAAGEGLTVRTLDPLADLDTPGDVVRFVGRRCVASPGSGRWTESALREMGLLPERALAR